jgi:two-component system, OmpR family, response regulator
VRALVVEDDAIVAADLVAALQAAGFVVDLAADGETAWFKGEVENYDLAILDLGLPRLDGLSVLRRWRAAGRDVPVLVLSARGDWTDKVEGIESGADDYLAKPFKMAERPRACLGSPRRRLRVAAAAHRPVDARHAPP